MLAVCAQNKFLEAANLRSQAHVLQGRVPGECLEREREPLGISDDGLGFETELSHRSESF